MPGGVTLARSASGDAEPTGAAPIRPGVSGRTPEPVLRRAPERVEGGLPSALVGKRYRPVHRASRNTRRGAIVAAGVLVALGAAATTFALVGPDASFGQELGEADQGADRVPADDLRAGPTPVSGDERTVSCWDGASVDAVRDCEVPRGREGMSTVFPAMAGSCTAAHPVVPGKSEVFTCRGTDFVVRYTRWEPGYDRFGYFDDENAGEGGRWSVDGEFAGRRWSSAGATADGVDHYRWTATYRAWPLSVEVQATTEAGRQAGVAAVEAAAPSQVARG